MSLSSVHIVCSEYVAAVERIGASLETLKQELTAMREQDVCLLKQLIQINEKIKRISFAQELKPVESLQYFQQASGCATLPKRTPQIIRQQSEPQFLLECQSSSPKSSSTSSQDTLGSLDGVSSGGERGDENTSSFRRLLFRLRPKSFSILLPAYLSSNELKGNDSYYDEVLERNIKMWKWSKTQETSTDSMDSVFEEEVTSLVQAEIER